MESSKKIIFFFLFLSLVFVSCSSEVSYSSDNEESSDLASVNFTVQTSEIKSLTVSNDASDIAIYTFKAVSNAEDAKGESTSFEAYNAAESGAGTISARFSPGYWTFTIRGSNSSGGVIYEGNKTVYLSPGENDVEIDISPVINTAEGLKGSLKINITAPIVSEDETCYFSFSCVSLTEANAESFSLTVPAAAVTRGTEDCSVLFTDENFSPGLYLLTVSYYENSLSDTAVSTAVTAFRIIESTVTEVSGRLDGFLFSSVNISVLRQDLSASMIHNGANSTFTVTPGGSGYTNVSYRWYINGTRVSETGSSLNYPSCFGPDLISASAGYYCISCIVMAQNSANGCVEAVCCRGHFTIDSSGNFANGAAGQ